MRTGMWSGAAGTLVVVATLLLLAGCFSRQQPDVNAGPPSRQQIQAAGLAPGSANESAIMVTLNPGAYTTILSGAGGGTGVGIVAVYAR